MSVATQAKLTLVGVDQTGRAFGSVNRQMSGLGSGLKKLAGWVAGAFAVQQIGAKVSSNIKAMGDIADSAQRLNVGTESLQRLGYAFNQLGLGGGAEMVEATFDGMRKAIAKVDPKVLKTVGLSMADLGRMAPEQQFVAIGTAIAGIADPSARAKAEIALLGKQSSELQPLFRAGAETFRQSMNDIMAAAPVIGDATIQQADRVGDGLATLKLSFNQTFNSALGEAMGWAERHFGRLDVVIPMMWERVKWFGLVVKTNLQDLGTNAWLIWEGMSKDWGETLRWMGRGIWEFVKATGGMLAELGKQFWNLITEGEWDGAAVKAKWQTLVDSLKPDWGRLGVTLVDTAIPSFEEYSKAARDRLTKAAEAADKIGAASQGTVVDQINQTAKKAVQAVKDAAAGLNANTYAAFTAAFRGGGAVQGAAVGARSAIGQAMGGQQAQQDSSVRELKSILVELRRQTSLLSAVTVTA